MMRTILAVSLWLAIAATGLAQETLRLMQGNLLRFRIADGRIAFDGARADNMNHTIEGRHGKEVISIRNVNGQPSVHYERTTKQDAIVLQLAGADGRFVMRREPRGDAPITPVEFRQDDGVPLSLTIGSGDARQEFRAPSLWRLLIVRPDECRQHLVPLLEMLRPEWRLANTAAAAEERLLKQEPVSAADRTRWAELVEQLGDDRFAKREAADRALRQGDVNVIAFLRQLDVCRLDAEQRFRIRRILDAVACRNGDDSVEQIAASLSPDPLVWLALLARPDPSTRQTAARQLAALLPEPIEIDPTADPETQKGRRERLRERLEER